MNSRNLLKLCCILSIYHFNPFIFSYCFCKKDIIADFNLNKNLEWIIFFTYKQYLILILIEDWILNQSNSLVEDYFIHKIIDLFSKSENDRNIIYTYTLIVFVEAQKYMKNYSH